MKAKVVETGQRDWHEQFFEAPAAQQPAVNDSSVKAQVVERGAFADQAAYRGPAQLDWLVLSGCHWHAHGGAQRPPQLTKALHRLGQRVAYASKGNPPLTTADGIAVGNYFSAKPFLQACVPGTVVVMTYPTYMPAIPEFRERGAHVAYDMLDDWEAFADGGDLWDTERHQPLELEREWLPQCDLVTTSAPFLAEKAKDMGARWVELVRNAGPPQPFAFPKELPPGMGTRGVRAVYVGYLRGSWFDWEIAADLNRDPGVSLTLVGMPPDLDGPHTELNCVGMKPWEQAVRYMAASEAAVIPFVGDELCWAVDPIKYYEHIAAGVWTVATPNMHALQDRPYVIFAERDDFPEAVREAARRHRTEPPDPAFLEDECWPGRARQLIELRKRLEGQRTSGVRAEPKTLALLGRAERIVEGSCDFHGGEKADVWEVAKEVQARWMAPALEWLQGKDPLRVVDLGCGFGTFAVAARLLGHEVTGIDWHHRPSAYGMVTWLRQDLETDAAIPAGPYDAAFALEVLEHLNYHPLFFLERVWAALEPGGVFVGSTPMRGVWPSGLAHLALEDMPCWQAGDVTTDREMRLYTPEEVCGLLGDAGFEVVSCEHDASDQTPAGQHFRWEARRPA